MIVIMAVCKAFGLTFSKIKTEITCLYTGGIPYAVATFSVEVAG